jgi:hypothetical protein
MRGAGGLDRTQPVEPADAVVDMDDEIAFGERRGIGEHVGGPALGMRPDETVAENILLADERRVFSLVTGLETEHRKSDDIHRQGIRRRPVRNRLDPCQAVVDQHLAHAVARALAP